MTYVNDGSDRPPRLGVYQAEWGLWGLGTAGREWTWEEKVDRCREAGFEGVLVFGAPAAGAEPDGWHELMRDRELMLGYGTFAATAEGIEQEVARARELGAAFVNAQMRDYFLTGSAATDFLKTAVRMGRDAGVPFFVETHRACLTQDLIRTVEYVHAVPDMVMSLDLSHFVVSGQVPTVDDASGPISSQIEDALAPLLERTASLHGRVSNGQAVQVDIGRDGDHPAATDFKRWWRRGMEHWLANAGPGDVLPFVTELGPPPVSITIRSADGGAEAEISDRWEQSLVLMRVARAIWEEVAAGA
ncbi:sugar phosphate isomerase/epimerase family protein [Capillimicrobium parvum]|uniref:Xylose isomerase n=1 Tax=Capillimicrobium parvum TaxID=2884022 RepID=A0A9E6XSF5_9ACTN|nr:sugar phosphate isomerase/epimerase [Capillimicrobium parvum]UGS33894.1 hypothetical protein DSM104329_00259 [Capillimicrobium parvum]